MRTLLENETRAWFTDLWATHQTEYFKLEVRQDYTGEDDGPALQAWLAGDRQRSLELTREQLQTKPYVKATQRKAAAGILMQRVRIVEEPLTPYTQWELSMLRANGAYIASQRLYVVGKAAMQGLQIPDGDMNIFDNRYVSVAEYTEQNRMCQATIYDGKEEDISPFLTLKNEALARSMPLKDYESPDLLPLE